MALPAEPTFVDNVISSSLPVAIDIGTRILGALALWIGGRFAIGLITRTVKARLVRRNIEPTLASDARLALAGTTKPSM